MKSVYLETESEKLCEIQNLNLSILMFCQAENNPCIPYTESQYVSTILLGISPPVGIRPTLNFLTSLSLIPQLIFDTSLCSNPSNPTMTSPLKNELIYQR